MQSLSVNELCVRYGETRVVDRVSFNVGQGERVCLLGPSGCGKTTTLQVIAGFVEAESGKVTLNNRDLAREAPEKRNIAIMFQNYALFPHMSIRDNVAFGLKMRRLPESKIKQRTDEALDRVKLSHLANRYPKMLSGGEQQRIAFARAIVTEPELLLLDEPFSNLDARLRQEMRLQLSELLDGLSIAALIVTHDQEEAMTLADRIIVMSRGHVEQQGSASEIYDRPKTAFVARFVGESNVFDGAVVETSGNTVGVRVEGLGTVFGSASDPRKVGSQVRSFLRPQAIDISPGEAETSTQLGVFSTRASIEKIVYLGHRTEIFARSGSQLFQIWQSPNVSGGWSSGQTVTLRWQSEDCFVFSKDDRGLGV